MKRKYLFIVIAIVIVGGGGLAFGMGAFGGAGGGGMTEHLTVSEALALAPGQTARVGGDVAPGSIAWTGVGLAFTLTGGGQDIRVSYPNVAPNDFKPGTKVLVEGTTSAGGVFMATTLQTTTSPLCRACHG